MRLRRRRCRWVVAPLALALALSSACGEAPGGSAGTPDETGFVKLNAYSLDPLLVGLVLQAPQ